MHEPHKDAPKGGKAAARKAPRRAGQVQVRHSPQGQRAEFAPVYAWRQEGDPPEVVHQGTLEDLAERQRAGIRTSGISVVAQHGEATGTLTKRATVLLRRWMKKRVYAPAGRPQPLTLLDDDWLVIRGTCQHARRAQRAKAAPEDPATEDPATEDPATGSLAAEPSTVPVEVTAELLRAAREKTGIESDAELVAFALSLLVEPDPAAEFLREERGSLPRDFRLDV